MQVLGITLKSLVFASNKVHFIIYKKFIQVILISGRWLKKINLLIEFWNSIFIKFYFKTYWHWTYIQKKLACKVSFKLFIYSPHEKRPKFFRGFTPKPPPRICHEPVAELTAPQDTHLHFTTFKNSIFVQKGILLKLLGQMLALRLIIPVTILMIGDVLIYRDWLTE